MDMGLGGLRELVMDREAWHAAFHGVAKTQTWLRDWTELNWTEGQELYLTKLLITSNIQHNVLHILGEKLITALFSEKSQGKKELTNKT